MEIANIQHFASNLNFRTPQSQFCYPIPGHGGGEIHSCGHRQVTSPELNTSDSHMYVSLRGGVIPPAGRQHPTGGFLLTHWWPGVFPMTSPHKATSDFLMF